MKCSVLVFDILSLIYFKLNPSFPFFSHTHAYHKLCRGSGGAGDQGE